MGVKTKKNPLFATTGHICLVIFHSNYDNKKKMTYHSVTALVDKCSYVGFI